MNGKTKEELRKIYKRLLEASVREQEYVEEYLVPPDRTVAYQFQNGYQKGIRELFNEVISLLDREA